MSGTKPFSTLVVRINVEDNSSKLESCFEEKVSGNCAKKPLDPQNALAMLRVNVQCVDFKKWTKLERIFSGGHDQKTESTVSNFDTVSKDPIDVPVVLAVDAFDG
jgi:ascorbate-specific PTS system EIIC-type component UlaA